MSQREVENKIDEAMTVAELIEHLQELDQEAHVLFTCNYGDFHRTEQALPVSDVNPVATSQITDSAYSRSGLALVDDDEDSGFYCRKCDEERPISICPKCGSTCVDEEGNLASVSADDSTRSVVVLN